MKTLRYFLLAMLCYGCQSPKENVSNVETPTLEVPSVVIGNWRWMSENVDTEVFNNGDSIPQAKTTEDWKKAGREKKPAWCYFNNEPADSAGYGKLYNWYAVTDERGLLPRPYTVPDEQLWVDLVNTCGGTEQAGHHLKSKTGWDKNGNGVNDCGFNAFPAGGRIFESEDGLFTGTFSGLGQIAGFWSKEAVEGDSTKIRGYFLFFGSPGVAHLDMRKEAGLSVRGVTWTR